MNDFSKLKVKTVYDSRDDIQEFYNSVLSNAVLYRRASGYFSHKLLKYISKGILGLIENSGKFELIISNQVDPETFKKILEGYEMKKINLESSFPNEQDLSDLAFLISLGLVDIKVAITNGIYHEKFGIVYDGEGNKILFSGSNNETQAAIDANFESFETTITWDSSSRDLEKIAIREKSFQDTWANENHKLKVLDAPDAIIKGLLEQRDITKTITKIEKETVYIDYNDRLEIFMNFDFDSSKWFMMKRWESLIEELNPRSIIFTSKIVYNDVVTIIDKLKAYFKRKEVLVLQTKSIDSFIEKYTLDIDVLKVEGMRIKAQDYFNSNHFYEMKDKINKTIKRSLRDPQIKSADHIISMKRSMNFSVPGSGKTATVLGAFSYLKSLKKVSKLLVIGPKNCFKSWVDEIDIVLNIDRSKILELNSVSDFAGKRIQLQYNYENSEVILLNYDGTINGSKSLTPYVDQQVMIVFDEIHRLKRIQGTTFLATFPIVKETQYRVSLTGTPLPNGYLDLYNQFLLLFGDYTRTYFGFHPHKLSDGDKRFKEEGKLSKDISSKMYPFYIRLNKDDLKVPKPEKDNIISVYETSDIISKYMVESKSKLGGVFNYMKMGIIPENIGKGNYNFEGNIEEELVFNDTHFYDINVITAKMQKIMELVKNIVEKKEKVIIWFNFIASLQKAYDLLKKEGFIVEKIHGSTDSNERNRIIDDFNFGNTQILITNPHTLAESVSLHKKCNNAIYAEMNYNLSQYLQSRDRIHRLGIEETRKTNYYIIETFINDYSLDAHIYDILNLKGLRMYDTIESSMLINKEEDEIRKKILEDR